MQTPRHIYIITFFFISWVLIGQSIESSILKFNNQYDGDEPEWSTCDLDSLLYKADTLTFVTKNETCCKNLSLTIRKNKITNINWNNMCVEPPREMTRSDIKKGKLIKRSNKYYITIKKSNKSWRKYEITEFKTISYFDSGNYPRHYYLMRLKKLI